MPGQARPVDPAGSAGAARPVREAGVAGARLVRGSVARGESVVSSLHDLRWHGGATVRYRVGRAAILLPRVAPCPDASRHGVMCSRRAGGLLVRFSRFGSGPPMRLRSSNQRIPDDAGTGWIAVVAAPDGLARAGG
jgi:hypothetical protein